MSAANAEPIVIDRPDGGQAVLLTQGNGPLLLQALTRPSTQSATRLRCVLALECIDADDERALAPVRHFRMELN